MIVYAQNLKLRNIGQLIELVSDGDVIMGILDRVRINATKSIVTVRISGEGHKLKSTDQVNIIRSSELYELYQAGIALESLEDMVTR